MPSNEVMPLFHEGKLHSGSSNGPVVTNPHQAKAIQLSYLRKEGHDIPKRRSHYRSVYAQRKSGAQQG